MYVRNDITAGMQYLHNPNLALCKYLLKNLLCISVNNILASPSQVEYLTQLALCDTHGTFYRSYQNRKIAHFIVTNLCVLLYKCIISKKVALLPLKIHRITIKEIDTFNVIKTVSVVDTQFA
jgi:hypothetical protein